MINENEFKELAKNMQDGLYFVDHEMKIVFWNKAAEKITGYKFENVIGKFCKENILLHVDQNGKNLCEGVCPLRRTIFDGKPRQHELYLHHKDGHLVPVKVKLFPRHNDYGQIIGGMELFSTAESETYRQDRLDRLIRFSLIDNLTELANREFIEKHIKGCLDQRRRHGIACGILFLDCDNFTEINEKYSRKTGDKILKEIAKTCEASIRVSDKISRWEKDKLCGVFQNLSRRGLFEMAERLRFLIQKTRIESRNRFVSVEVSIGGVLAEHDDDLESLINQATKLVSICKEKGKNQVLIENYHSRK